jgi:DNA-binding MarR family transcriptional regulator
MRPNRAMKHQDGQGSRKPRKKRPTSTSTPPSSPLELPPTYHQYTPTPGPLLQRGNYSLLRLLSILNSAGADGLPTLALLETLGSKADRMNAIIRTAEEMELIERIPGKSEHGQFPPIYNKITERGKQLLQNHLSSY